MLKARATIPCPDPKNVFDTLLEAIAAHMQTVDRLSEREACIGDNREMHFLVTTGGIEAVISTDDPTVMNHHKYSVSSLIDFHFRQDVEPVVWEGDAQDETLPKGLQCLEVTRVEQISPGFKRVWFGGDNVSNYDTLEHIHSRLLFKQGRGVPLEWPKMTSQGSIRWPEGIAKLDTRIFTIRYVDRDKNELAVDFFLGDHSGPATEWARGAKAGDRVGFIGPAAHGIVRADFCIYIGDETGLPGIARCLESLAFDAKGIALLMVDNSEDRLKIDVPKGIELKWVETGGLAAALQNLQLPPDTNNCALWCGAEYSDFKLAKNFATEKGIPKESTVSFAHWHLGMNEPEIAAAGSQSVA